MKRVLSYRTALTAILAALTFWACEYKDLGDYDGTKKTRFTISFDWDKVDSIPKSMRVVFYPMDISRYALGYTIFDVLNKDTVIELVPGVYDVTAWNNDAEHVVTTGYSKQNTVNATTGNYSPHGDVRMPKVLDSLYMGQKILDYPDYMVHANKMQFELSATNDIHRLILSPDSMVVTVEVKLHGIRGLQYCHNIRGAINNVAGRRYMAYDNLTQDTVTVMFDGQKVEEDSMVTAKFWVFGIEPTDLTSLSHKLVMFFWVTGNQVFLPIDVTKIVARARQDDTYVLIETDDLNLNLEDFIRLGETGISVDAEDWDETEEIILNF